MCFASNLNVYNIVYYLFVLTILSISVQGMLVAVFNEMFIKTKSGATNFLGLIGFLHQ
jgi:hypothetical protein